MTDEANTAEWLRALKARRRYLMAQIATLQRELKQLESMDIETEHAPVVKARKGNNPKRKNPPRKRGDFRNSIREVLRSATRPHRPVEVTSRLKDMGIENPGKSDMTSRIATELYKLAKAGELTKTPEGYVWAGK
jgi:hypothetical protein